MFAVLTLLSLASTALAHGGVLSYSNAGNWYWGWQPYNTPTGQTSIERPWSSYNPITDATDSQLACNDDGTSSALQLTANVAAGSKITAFWNTWPHPYGPMFTYLASCGSGSCTGVNANGLQWFKIDQAGLINGTVYDGVWGDGIMINQNSSWTTTIPASIPSGNYLIRFETIALHSLPAQFYPECAQINVSGGGSLQPTSAELCAFPGCYSNTDPGLTVDIYSNAAQTETTYPLPGPPLYAGATVSWPSQTGSSGSSSSSSASSSSSKSTGTSTSATKTSTSTSASSTATGTVGEYGQCGGTGYTGGTVCVSPYVCTYSNAYYSQCL